MHHEEWQIGWNNAMVTCKSELENLRDKSQGQIREGINQALDIIRQLTLNK